MQLSPVLPFLNSRNHQSPDIFLFLHMHKKCDYSCLFSVPTENWNLTLVRKSKIPALFLATARTEMSQNFFVPDICLKNNIAHHLYGTGFLADACIKLHTR